MLSTAKSRPQVPHYNIILLGKTGVGKSASGNTLLGEKVFISKKSVKTVTDKVQKETATVDGVTLDVYDTPGLFDPQTKNENDRSEWKKLLNQTICPVILLVMKVDRVSQEDKDVVDLIEDVIPERFIQNIWILFTRGDELERENLSIEEFIEDTDELKEIVQRFENRYHVFNNFSESSEQVRMLIHKIKDTEQIMYPPSDPSMGFPQTTPDHLYMRIVLVGKTGTGKSATGNTILGESRFRSEISASSVSSESEIQEAVVSGRNISVTDTPGLFDTKLTHEQFAEEIGRSIYLSSPGPHAFLYVHPVNVRFTTQEKDVLQKLELSFGEKLHKYTIIVFTFGDLLKGKSVDTLIQENSSLRQLVEQCGGRYHIMNNTQRKKQQVTDLLEKIDRMIQQNGGMHYTSEMFENAQRFKTFKEFFHECKNSLILSASVGCGGAVGARSGVAIVSKIGGAVGGPVGAGVGAVIGTVVGLVTGTGIGVGVHKLVNKQKSQSAADSGDEEVSEANTDDTANGTESENVYLCPQSNSALKQ